MINILLGVLFVLSVLILINLIITKNKYNEQMTFLKDEISKMLIDGLTVKSEVIIEENTRKFNEIEKTIILNNKNNLLQGITELNKELSGNNEKILLQFTNLGQSLGNNMNENNQLISNNINKFKDEFKKNINDDFESLNKKIENRLDMMNTKVEERLSKGFEETTKTFGNVLERLSKIDEAQKKIEALSVDVVSLQDVLTDKKSRGIFGEVQLYQILTSVFGDKNDKIYKTQYKLSNGTMVDSIIFTPEPMGNIAIDSKFPLENYRRLYEKDVTEDKRIAYRKEFVNDMKKHIDAISEKYIIKNETSDQAILFLPAEAIFAEINAYHTDIIDYSYKKNVRIASPTTLISVLTMIQMVMKNIERDKYAHVIQEELGKLQQDFDRYEKRWSILEKDINKITKDVKDITTTSTKISKRFNEISNVNMSIKIDDENIENVLE
ncbi:MAG: DNA recombination protein RmuC [Leptotrichiaceae bacterium]|nr:DNA recombination protein RmuC [Leptotrichiaceae bacterium]MBP7100624.1 DNA recombination protein RmuC [Leptotrichiaceae bacterium]MBP7739110.1 DNA recombination protein RmuC [Leptotrichiaceae bacterium]MBP9629854.1 DNA recombination protein RmuC [Leptotrichiaceae bacterium]